MNRRSASILAWSAAVTGTACALAGGILAAFAGGEAIGDYVLFFLLAGALVVAAAAVGALVASRRPDNPIGWIFCGFGVFMGLAMLAAGHVEVAPEDATNGLGQWSAWFANWSFVALLVLSIFVLLLFPNGRLLSPRWRLAGWCGAAGTVTLAAGSALEPGRLVDFPDVTNPVSVGEALSGALRFVGSTLTLLALAAAVASVVQRYRRADDAGRQQIKWLAVAAVFTACAIAVGGTVAIVGPAPVGYSLILLGILAIPVAIGVAILRYRLYDLDRVISRSLTYGLVTGMLAAAYAALVLATQAAFSSFAGGSDLAIAISTLVVAGLFMPLRARVQRFVDRRFYRRRYDAARTLETFGARLRERVDLDGLRTDLEGVVQETMRPAQLSLWLREEARR